MTESAKTGFALECEKKFDELVAWAVLNAESGQSLSASNFADLREHFCHIATSSNVPPEDAEPAEGGAQYVNVTPAPWP